MKVLIAHKNRVFYELFHKSSFHNCSQAQIDFIQSGSDLLESLDKSYDLILAGADLFGFSAIDAFNKSASFKSKTILLLDTKEDFINLDFLGKPISIFDCSEDSLETLNRIISPEFNGLYISSTVRNYFDNLLTFQGMHVNNQTLKDYSVEFILWYITNEESITQFAARTGRTKNEVEIKRNRLKKLMGVNGVVGFMNFAQDNGLIGNNIKHHPKS